MRLKVGHFEPDGGLVYLPIGFVPDFLIMVEIGASNPMIYLWWEMQQDDQASGSQEGTQINGADGVVSKIADGSGITEYDSAAMLPNIGVWRAGNSALLHRSTGASITITARTSLAHGTYCIGTTSGTTVDGTPVDREQLFEAVTVGGNTGASEPSWPVETGQQVTDGSIVWELVSDVALTRIGYQGVSVAAAMMTNGQEMYYAAFDADSAVDHGDVDGWTGGVYGA